MTTEKLTAGVEACIRESNRIFPTGEAGISDGAPHIYLSDDGVFMYGDTCGCAELDASRAEELAEKLAELEYEDAVDEEDRPEPFFALLTEYEVEGSGSW